MDHRTCCHCHPSSSRNATRDDHGQETASAYPAVRMASVVVLPHLATNNNMKRTAVTLAFDSDDNRKTSSKILLYRRPFCVVCRGLVEALWLIRCEFQVF